MSDLREIATYKSFEAIKNILDDTELHDLQCVDVMRMLVSKRAIVSYATGLGKTLLAAAVMRLLWNEDPTRKFIFFGEFGQLSQTPGKLEKLCKRRVLSSFAASKSVERLFQSDYTNYSVLFLTHQTLLNDKIMNDLFKHRTEYSGVFVDEAHKLSNKDNASSAAILSGLARQFEYCYALTATPITTDVVQLARLANIVDYERYPNVKRLTSQVKNGSFCIEDDPCFFINRTRAEFGSITDYHGIVELVSPLPHQRVQCGGNKLLQICKGDGAFPQAEALIKLLQQRKGLRGLIYINQHSVREWVLPFLEQAGIRYACINGATSLNERKAIMQRFNIEHNLDVIVTAVTAALDLDCDFVIFYEFTVDVKQMIGRAHRGLGNKEMDIIFIITDESAEIDYFYNNIFAISMEIQRILKQDYSELLEVDRELQNAKI